MSVESDDDEEETEQTSRPYMTLLQSLQESSAPNAKRRKLDHGTEDAEASDSDEESEHSDEEKSAQDADLVEEEEEEEEEEVLQAGEDEEDSEDEGESLDPFDVHFAHPDETSSAKAVNAVKSDEWKTERRILGPLRATVQSAGSDSTFSFLDMKDIKLKQKLQETCGKTLSGLDEAQKHIASLLFNYQDVLYCDRNVDNAETLRRLVCSHALNHIFKTRDRVIKNNHKLAKDAETEQEFRDQGFTRPKVLFLLPTRNSCANMVRTIRDLCKPDQEENRKRFDESYITKDNIFGADRPADFRDLFEGNDDDMFRLGVKFTRKTIKYFAQFYSSDILFASPLGLRMAMGSEEDKKKPDSDFLSSIEVVVVDQADALLMQNWEHIEYIFERLNLQPKDAHGCDIGRLRPWYLDDWARYFRQTVLLSGFHAPELAELQRSACRNWAGKARLQPAYDGVLVQLGVKARQTFSRFQSHALDGDPDARFAYFVSAVVPGLVKRAKDAAAPGGTLLFVPSYLDFVRVRNYFATSVTVAAVSFGAVSEYTDVPEASRARSHFVTGRHKVLLYSERAHHFRRFQIKGVQRVIFYGLPDNPVFYKEIAGEYLSKSEQDFTIEPGKGAVRVLFSKYDAMKLERVAGSKRVGKMLQDRGDTFDFI
ncbi:nucleolus protein required for cell viability, putative [Cordyceps militaris CM01]|uniref:U3 small nucleolar RNA-associated protein 25 n=1 Tax=Cordyceps militaris (strain CM01) TaxID=983644 RepID=G3J7A5_CORMM|nr:nucleolus protein required for cell viability, putative [Cordyceps militaris CM01]EGX96275.1 nucleolus protein required for cell viability, putative [Cordyceps militaris CM01]